MILAAALMALPALAQSFGANQAEQPNAAFQSTSTMTGSGSQYSANPTLNNDGTASYNSASNSPAKVSGGPRKNTIIPQPNDPSEKIPQEPIGDAVLPLMLCAFAFCAVTYLRRKRSAA